MKKCVIIVNKMSGNSSHADENKLTAVFGKDYDVKVIRMNKSTVLYDLSEYDRVVVCGGDGTLHNAINCKFKKKVDWIYCPYGTLNELATGNGNGQEYVLRDVGTANDRKFAYVCACGIFTPLGYVVKDKYKKRFKALAYLSKVVSQYKVHRIDAEITADGKTQNGQYTLIMLIDSPKCFGFRFNKMFRLDDGKLHMLTIKSPKHNGFFGGFKLFFPLFRTFFIGFKKEYHSKNIDFSEVTEVTLKLQKETDFCMDGEKVPLNGDINLKAVKFQVPIKIIALSKIEKCFKNGETL